MMRTAVYDGNGAEGRAESRAKRGPEGKIEQITKLALGCMRLDSVPQERAEELVRTALDLGVYTFDHADIYGGGKCESIFGTIMRRCAIDRDSVFIQTKCGIVPGEMFDFSKEHIVRSVEQSLQRLQVDYVDSLLLHRPDMLMEPEEVAAAFDTLHAAGKVRYFGVSNHTVWQIELLKKYVRQPLWANQVQFGPAHALLLCSDTEQNMTSDGAVNRGGGLLDYCRLNNMTMQAWSPFQFGLFEGVFLNDRTGAYRKLNAVLEQLGQKYSVTPMGIVTAWILRHPADWQVLSGTTNPSRLREMAAGTEICLSRRDWYAIYMAAGNPLP